MLYNQDLHLLAPKMFYWHPNFLEMYVRIYTMKILSAVHWFNKRFPISDEIIKHCESVHHKQLEEEALSNRNITMLQIDFAKNFTPIWQDETQFAHWKKKQVAFLMAVNKNINQSTSAVVSDDFSHTKDLIITWINLFQTLLVLVYED